MPDYKSMYFRLFNRVSEAIIILQAAQQEGEDAYIEDHDGVIIRLAGQPIDDKEEK